MDPIDLEIITTFTTMWGSMAVGKVTVEGFTPNAKFTVDAVYSWSDLENSREGTSDVNNHGVVTPEGKAVFYCLLGPVPNGSFEGTIQEHSATFSETVSW